MSVQLEVYGVYVYVAAEKIPLLSHSSGSIPGVDAPKDPHKTQTSVS